MKPFESISNPRELRRKLRLNQSEFWSKVGVTQSGGSRYETGRRIPRPVRELVRLVHVEGIVLAKAKGDDLAIGAYLRKANPQLYARAKKAVAGK
ncbi:MAG: transcriptional regulator [Betaproteobacteria bacterium RIFCSPLOWO2_02_64_14]|nr:MAG: transcriptional regulator [Betaproteobacteria bacterium RIFCSPLOWO2_02_64_14]